MRKMLLVGNWKMHLNTHEASMLMHRLHEHIPIYRHVEVVIAPSMLTLQPLSVCLDRRKFRLAAQNAYHIDDGAYTGEVSFSMLRDLVHYVIIGHSERRHVFGEDLKTIQLKMAAAVRNGITPILCVGETKNERAHNETNKVIHDQLTTAIHGLTSEEIETLVIAYEPVWAISSGTNYAHHETATPEVVEKMVTRIRSIIEDLYGKKVAQKVRVLYGGSSNAENAEGYLRVNGVDGLLPGGASLNYWQFSRMAETAAHVWREKGVEN